MSLMTDQMETFTMIDKTTSPDGYGGVDTTWKDGASFDAVATKDTSLQARIAEKQDVTDIYSIITRKNINLQFHDVVRRESDKKIFRVTSNGDDKATPKSAGLNMRVVTAEEWELPS